MTLHYVTKYHEEICYLLDVINEREVINERKEAETKCKEKKLCIFEKVSIRMLQLMASSWKESMVLYILAHAKRVAENVKLIYTDALHKQNPR